MMSSGSRVILLSYLGLIGWALEEVPQSETKYDFIAIIVETSNSKFHCTGSLVSPKIVFTSCDCIGGFLPDAQLKLIFRPIQPYHHFVFLGVKDFEEAVKYRRNLRVYAIEEIIVYQTCSYDLRLGFLNNLGALRLTEAATRIPQAPGLVAHTKTELESYVLDRVYNEEQCIVLGYGSFNKTRPVERLRLRIIDVSLVPFLKCKGRICPIKCLLNIDIANNQEMCGTGSNETVNCYADRGSPLICQGHFMGVIKYVHCDNRTSPLQITRMSDALPFYLSLVNCSNSPTSQMGLILILILASK
ncbi:hypothetical protein GE061_018194 [Apolygus lucorum]|uniref:Uncharacterized protein n=1 Tax=Apolygus lucorum TaxID=248454 RepID=A0A6A4J8W5_APOLU|nr:hypothetical protein GE061_018194 [Apolygus lucorum]